MAFIPAADTIKCILTFASNQNNFATNILWMKDTLGTPDAARLQELEIIFDAWASSEWDTIASNAWELDTLTLQDWTTENSIVDNSLPSVVGGSASPSLPATVTIAVSLRTGFAGRSNRGRLYHVGLTESMVTGDFILTGSGTDVVNVYEALRVAAIAEGFAWSVASFVTAGAPRVTAQVTPITSIVLTNLALDTMRSRHGN